MTENEFSSLLSKHGVCTDDSALIIERAIEIVDSVIFNLVPDDSWEKIEICGASIVAWDAGSVISQDSNGKLYRLAQDRDGDLVLDQDPEIVFATLEKTGRLGKVLNPIAVAELDRLKAKVVEARRTKKREEERSEYERLRAKFEGK